MDRVTINIDCDGSARASEIIADLRNVAETLFFPMKLAGFWDAQADIHLCPDEERGEACFHRLPPADRNMSTTQPHSAGSAGQAWRFVSPTRRSPYS